MPPRLHYRPLQHVVPDRGALPADILLVQDLREVLRAREGVPEEHGPLLDQSRHLLQHGQVDTSWRRRRTWTSLCTRNTVACRGPLPECVHRPEGRPEHPRTFSVWPRTMPTYRRPHGVGDTNWPFPQQGRPRSLRPSRRMCDVQDLQAPSTWTLSSPGPQPSPSPKTVRLHLHGHLRPAVPGVRERLQVHHRVLREIIRLRAHLLHAEEVRGGGPAQRVPRRPQADGQDARAHDHQVRRRVRVRRGRLPRALPRTRHQHRQLAPVRPRAEWQCREALPRPRRHGSFDDGCVGVPRYGVAARLPTFCLVEEPPACGAPRLGDPLLPDVRGPLRHVWGARLWLSRFCAHPSRRPRWQARSSICARTLRWPR